MTRLNSRKLWVSLIGMALIAFSPIIAGSSGAAGSMVTAISLIAMAYVGGQGAVDAITKHTKQKETGGSTDGRRRKKNRRKEDNC